MPYDTKTAWKRKDKPDVLYTLAELYFCQKMKSEKYGAYNDKCAQFKVKSVPFIDRKSLIDYFTAEKEDRSHIDATIWA